MDGNRSDDPPRPGLRERKKAKTRALIQEHALRLFRTQGYDETTVGQVAEAAEVSPSTVFRYFPTKPDLVIYDALDESWIEAFRSQPSELSALQALRASIRTGLGAVVGDDLALQLERERLMRSVPELRAAMLDEFVRTLNEIAALLAERTGRAVDDDYVVALAGAVLGVSIAAWLGGGEGDASVRYVERIDAGLALLEDGFRL